MNTTYPPRIVRRMKERKLNFKQLLLLTLTLCLRHAFAVQSLLFILCHAAKNEPRKRAQAFPLGTPSFAALQRARREVKYKLLMLCLDFRHHERQAEKAKRFLSKRTHLGRALMRPRWRRLAKAKAPAALKKPSGGGVPRGVPLVPFLATSWGMPRSSISDPAAHCAADKG